MTQSTRLILFVVGAALVAALLGVVFNQSENSGTSGQVWSEAHGHYH